MAAPDANGELSRFLTPSINAFDQVTFYTWFANTANGTGDDRGIMIADKLGAGIVLREGQPGPNNLGTVNYFNAQDEQQPLLIDLAGRVVATTNLTNLPGVNANITRGDGANPIEAIVSAGDGVPGGGASFGSFFLEGISQAGDILYRSFLEGAPNGTSPMLVLDTFTDRKVIARAGGAAADGNGAVNTIAKAGVGDGGHVAMVAQYRNTVGGSADDYAVTRHHASGDNLILREGDAAPSGNGVFRGNASRMGKPWVTEWGLVALNVEYAGTAGGFTDNHGIVRYKQHDVYSPELVELIREGDPAPDGDGEFNTISDIRSMNDAGVVLFEGRLRNSVSTGSRVGIYLTDGYDTLHVAQTVSEFGLGPDALNEHGQVAYRAGGSPGSGAHGVYLFTPELYWRGHGIGGSWWDTTGNVSDYDNFSTTFNTNPHAYINWTLGLKPAAVHDVIFDRDRYEISTTFVTWDAAVDNGVDATVRSLTFRAEAGLLMVGGRITALEGFFLEADNRIDGYGEFHGNVSIGPGARLTSDNLNVFGDIDVDATGELRFSPAPGNLAYFTEIHGDVHNDGTTLVRSGQIIFANDPSMHAEIHGDFFNNGVLQIASTLPDPRNDRIDIFGDYYGPGEIVNNGTVVFHGGFFPGASPVRHQYQGTGTMELSNTTHTIMEIAGLAAGSGHYDPSAEYDSVHLVDGGTLVLGGTLEIDLIPPAGEPADFVPSLGDLFVLFTAGEILGDFDTPLVLPELVTGLYWQVVRDAGSFAVAVSAVPLPAAGWLLLPVVMLLRVKRRQ